MERSSRAEFNKQGKLQRIVGMVVDITERKRAEEQLQVQLHRELEVAYCRLVTISTDNIRETNDINDFDETLPAPWEWDVKRLAASIVLGLREIGLGEGRCKDAVYKMAHSYREQMHRHARMHPLDVWYSRIDADEFVKEAKTAATKKRWEQVEAEARKETSEHIAPEITCVEKGRMRFLDHPPLIYHPRQSDLIRKHVSEMFRRYRETLPEERRILLDRYRIVDVARKVVGVGSVGTRCAVVLLLAHKDDTPLLLQFKEALPSVLESYAGKTVTGIMASVWLPASECCNLRATCSWGGLAMTPAVIITSASFVT